MEGYCKKFRNNVLDETVMVEKWGDAMRTFTAIVILIVLTFLFGCEKNELQKSIKSLHDQVNILEVKLSESQDEMKLERNKNIEKTKEIDLLKRENAELEIELNKIIVDHERLQRITKLEDFYYNEVGFKEDERVIYIKNVPDDLTIRQTYLLRAAIEFSNDTSKMISFWGSMENAKTYIRGDYNSEETLFGWLGFGSIIGKINNSVSPPSLTFYLSGHDMENLEFGKYGYKDR